MKLPLTVVALLLVLMSFTPTVKAQTCSCKAPDSDCNAEVTCKKGCTAFCASNDACYAACNDMDVDLLRVRVTLKMEGLNANRIAAALSRRARKKIEFIPNDERQQPSVDFNHTPLYDALEHLSLRGKVIVGGVEFEKFKEIRRMMLNGKKLSMSLNGITVKDAVAKLSSLSGLPFRVESGDDGSLLSISLHDVTLDEIIARISGQTGVKIEQPGKRSSTK